MDYAAALPIAEKLVSLLAPACTRIEIAGSLRRRKPDPGDIEIVARPDLRPVPLMFGQKPMATRLDQILYCLERGDDEDIRLHASANGAKYKKYYVSLDGGQTWCIQLDLFCVTPPSDWGVQYLIRTGPSDFSHWIVTSKSIGGGLPIGYKVEGGRLLNSAGEHIPCPEEIDFLRFCGLAFIEPKNRRPMWVHPIRRIELHQTVKL